MISGIDLGGRKSYSFADSEILSSFDIPELVHSAQSSQQKHQIVCDLLYKNVLDDQVWDHIWLLGGLPSLWYKRLAHGHLLRFCDQIEFEVSCSLNRVIVYCAESVSHEYVCHALVDQLLPRVIAQRGKMVLHGCGLADDYGVSLFLGNSGWGKSTLAHYLSQQGMTLISDDCVVLSFGGTGGVISCVPTYPSLRLASEGVQEFFADGLPANAIPISEAKKVRVPVPGSIEVYEGPLRRVVFLSDPAEAQGVEVLKIPSGQAVMKLVGNCFRLDMNDKNQTVSLLDKAAAVVESVKVQQVSYPHDYSCLPEVAAVIAEL